MTEYFLKLGAKVVIGSRNQEKIDNCINEFSDLYGNNIIGTACDVRHYDHVKNLIKYGEDHFGAINGLVNNAAGNFISPTERLSVNAFSVIIDIVLKGSCNTTLALG